MLHDLPLAKQSTMKLTDLLTFAACSSWIVMPHDSWNQHEIKVFHVLLRVHECILRLHQALQMMS